MPKAAQASAVATQIRWRTEACCVKGRSIDLPLMGVNGRHTGVQMNSLRHMSAVGALGHLGSIDAGQPHSHGLAGLADPDGVAVTDRDHAGALALGAGRQWPAGHGCQQHSQQQTSIHGGSLQREQFDAGPASLLQIPARRTKLGIGSGSVMARFALLLSLAAVAVGGPALAQQPVQPLPKVGSCPLGYFSSGGYCVPSKSGNSRGAIEKVGGGCPLGFYSSGNYCVSSPNNNREAIQKTGKSCPLGWFSSGGYCVRSR
jgi:hypothetical protein